MSMQPNKRTNPEVEMRLALGSLVVVLVAAAAVLLPWLAALLAGVATPGGPVMWLLHRPWSGRATVALASMLVLLLVPVVGLTVVVARGRRGREWTDQMASHLSSSRDVREMSRDAVTKDSTRLGYADLGPGVVLGREVRTRMELFGTFEWSQVWVMGTRAGKSRRVAVRQLAQHQGPAVSTSNKRDVHDKTRGLREERGLVWVSDPQEIIGEPTAWWWNPLSYVTNVQRADALVGLWAASRSSEDTKSLDPYFDPEGRKFAANMLLAAAVGGEDMRRLADWLTGTEPEPGVPDPTVLLDAHDRKTHV